MRLSINYMMYCMQDIVGTGWQRQMWLGGFFVCFGVGFFCFFFVENPGKIVTYQKYRILQYIRSNLNPNVMSQKDIKEK